MNDFDALYERIVADLHTVPGVEAIVLGGSRARGTHRPDSDVDIGIYYDTACLDLVALEEVAQRLNDERGEQLVAGPGGWGAWVNGGAWLTVGGQRVDFILRDLARVRAVVVETQGGVFTANYQPGHPHAFISVMYMGELAVSRLLWDRTGKVAALQTGARVYPVALKRSLLGFFAFEAGFSCSLAETYADKDETYWVTAHLVRSVSCLNQVIFALNEQYCLNEKGAVKAIESFAIQPARYKQRVDKTFLVAGSNPTRACTLLRDLVTETEHLTRAALD